MTSGSATPAVSVVMPAYDRERLLPAAMDSVLAQTFDDFELIVVDDGSSDRTAEVAASTGDPRVRVVRNERNLGVGASRNVGLDQARGEFVANLDSDDLAHPRRLERQVARLRARPELALLGSWAQRIDADGRATEVIRRPCGTARIRSQLLFRNCFKNTTVIGRRDVLLQHRYREQFTVNEDVDLHVRVALAHEVDNLPEVLASYREHPGSLSGGERYATSLADRAIASEQLDRLGVEHDRHDLGLHRRIRWLREPRLKRSEIDRVDRWLLRLRDANRRRGLYPEPWFGWVLANRWWRVCRFSIERPRKRWRRWARSPLARSLAPAWLDAHWTRLRGRDSW